MSDPAPDAVPLDEPAQPAPAALAPASDWIKPRPRAEGETDDSKRILEALAIADKQCDCTDVVLPDNEQQWRDGKLVAVRLMK